MSSREVTAERLLERQRAGAMCSSGYARLIPSNSIRGIIQRIAQTTERFMRSTLALVALFLASAAFADAPLRPPEKLTVCSPARNVCATSDPATKITLVSPTASGKEPWTIPGWHRWLFVSDDAESIVVGYDGMNLVPLDVTLEEPVLFFHNKGKLVRTITLGDLYESKSQLKRTVSHFAWTDVPVINNANQLVVELVDGRKVAFAATTGEVQPVVADGT